MEVTRVELLEEPIRKKAVIKPWREVASLAMMLMELSWLTLWYRLLTSADQEVPYPQAAAALAGMLIFVYLLRRLLVYLEVGLLVQRLALLLALVINEFAGLRLLLYTRESTSLGEILNRPLRTFQDLTNIVPAEFIVMVFVLLVCWRGIAYSDNQISSVNALSGFRLGIIMFFLFGLTLPFVNESPELALYMFLFFSLLALPAARIAVLSQLRGGQSIHFNRQWIIGISLVIVGMVGISMLVVYFTREQIFSVLAVIFSWLVYLVVLLVSPLLFLVLQFFIWLFGAIRIGDIFQFIVQALNDLGVVMNGMIDAVSHWMSRFNIDRIAAFFESITGLKPLYLWGTLFILVAAFLLGLRRFVVRGEDVDEAQVDTEQIDENLFQLLRSTLRDGLDKLADNLEEILRLRRARRLLAAARIRRIYAMLLGLNERLENPRTASRTPLEYLPQMERLFPSLSSELATITETYMLVRYGEVPESSKELERVEAAWKRVSSVGKEQLKAKKRLSH